MKLRDYGYFFHRVCAANRAISARCSGLSFVARAFPPLGPPALPRATAAGSTPLPDRFAVIDLASGDINDQFRQLGGIARALETAFGHVG
jgi:hypothetical protein